MVREGKGRLFRRKAGKYLIYLPLDLVRDSMFSFTGPASILVRVRFQLSDKLIIEKCVEP
jgi:hypothetical protein